MGFAPVVASALLALTGGLLGHASHLRALDPATLQPRSAALWLPGDAFGVAWARSGSILALVTKPTGGTAHPIRLIDTRRMRIVGTIAVGNRDVCGLGWRGGALVGLVAEGRPCYWKGAPISVIQIDVRTSRIVQVTSVPGLTTVLPPNLAFGDGFAFVARGGGGVLAVDLATGALTRHIPRRALAKGGAILSTNWLGDHQLGVGGRVVDVRTWRWFAPEPGADAIRLAGPELAVLGRHGLALYTHRGKPLSRFGAALANPEGRYVYVEVGPAEPTRVRYEVVDLRRHGARLVTYDGSLFEELLLS
jgi:hypothetical protein